MWESIASSALPVMIKLIGMFLDWKQASEDEKKSYLSFIEQIEKHNLSCANLRKDYLSQRDKNLNKIKELQK